MLVVYHALFMCGVFTYVVCFFLLVPVSLRSWGFVRLCLVRLHPFVFFMDSFFFLAGFQARWPSPWISLLSLLYVALPTTCLSSLPNCHEPLTFVTLPRKPLFGYVTALLSPSYSVASCRWRWRLLHVGLCLCWDITISLILLMHLYTW